MYIFYTYLYAFETINDRYNEYQVNDVAAHEALHAMLENEKKEAVRLLQADQCFSAFVPPKIEYFSPADICPHSSYRLLH